MTELEQPDFTRRGASKEHGSTLSRIDRIYTSIPPWIRKMFQTSVQLIMTPHQAQFWKLSDHGSLGASLSTRVTLPAHICPIPTWLTAHPIFASTLEEIEVEMDIDNDRDPCSRWNNHKIAIRRASHIALNRIMANQARTPAETIRILLPLPAPLPTATPHWYANISNLCLSLLK